MGMDAGPVGARDRRLPRSGAAGRFLCVCVSRHTSSGDAGSAAERPCERRAAQARRRSGRRASTIDAPRNRISRSGALVDAQGRLGRSLRLDRAASALMTELPLSARRYVIAVIAAGGVVLAICLPIVNFHQPALFFTLVV